MKILDRTFIAFASLLSVVALAKSTAVGCNDCDCGCRSNETHIAWRIEYSFGDHYPPHAVVRQQVATDQRLHHRSPLLDQCEWQPIAHARRDAYEYLRQNVLPFDEPFRSTMGFHDDSNDISADGLADGLIGPTIELALLSKRQNKVTDHLPRAIWEEYVLNYHHLNEARSNWRALLYKKLSGLVLDESGSNILMNHSEIVTILNGHMWQVLAPADTESIKFVSGSTPLIFDPMSVLVFGYGSCTGVSILLASALRSVGVPARVAGTAAWNGRRDKGNHNWVEVWQGGTWHFMEPTLSVGKDPDNLERDPCKRWFCRAKQWENGTQAFAARFEPSPQKTYFPLAWEWDVTDIPAENRTAYYHQTCLKC